MEKCPKCGADSTAIFKSDKIYKCKNCNHSGYPADFRPKATLDILDRFGFGDCWNCKTKHKKTELREIPQSNHKLCEECFKTFSAIMQLVLRSLK